MAEETREEREARLIAEVRQHHTAVGTLQGQILTHAIQAGEAISHLKRTRLPNLTWDEYCRQHFGMTPQHANNYERIWLNRERVEAERRGDPHLTLRGVLKLLAGPVQHGGRQQRPPQQQHPAQPPVRQQRPPQQQRPTQQPNVSQAVPTTPPVFGPQPWHLLGNEITVDSIIAALPNLDTPAIRRIIDEVEQELNRRKNAPGTS